MVIKEILEFIFQDCWHFLGTCLLLEIIVEIIYNYSIRHNKNKADK